MGEKMKWLDNYVPPGLDGYGEFKIYIGAVIFATLESFLYFVIRYSNAYSNLFDYRFGKRVLIENVFIGSYDYITEGVFWVPVLICIAIFFVIVYHYMYHRWYRTLVDAKILEQRITNKEFEETGDLKG